MLSTGILNLNCHCGRFPKWRAPQNGWVSFGFSFQHYPKRKSRAFGRDLEEALWRLAQGGCYPISWQLTMLDPYKNDICETGHRVAVGVPEFDPWGGTWSFGPCGRVARCRILSHLFSDLLDTHNKRFPSCRFSWWRSATEGLCAL